MMEKSAHPSRRHIFLLVATGAFLSTMDSSMINVALPSIMRSFATTLPRTEWVVLIYLLTITLTLMVWGYLSDRYGQGRIYLFGMLVFTLGSTACSLSPTLSLLLLFRFIQALGAAMMMASGPAIIKNVSPHDHIGRELGLLGVATSIGLMSGPAVSGFLISSFSWRAIFLVTVPVSLTAYLAGSVFIARRLPHGISQERRRKVSMFPLFLFGRKEYSIAMLVACLSFVVLFILLIVMPFYMDFVLRMPVDRIGLVMMAVPLTLFIVSPASGALYDRIGAGFLTTTGLGISCLAVLSLLCLNPASGIYDIAWRLALLGTGQSIFLSPNTASVLARIEAEYTGITSGVLATSRNIGMLLGAAIAGMALSAFFSSFSGGLDLKDYSSLQVHSFMQAYRGTLGIAALIALSGAVLSALREAGKQRTVV